MVYLEQDYFELSSSFGREVVFKDHSPLMIQIIVLNCALAHMINQGLRLTSAGPSDHHHPWFEEMLLSKVEGNSCLIQKEIDLDIRIISDNWFITKRKFVRISNKLHFAHSICEMNSNWLAIVKFHSNQERSILLYRSHTSFIEWHLSHLLFFIQGWCMCFRFWLDGPFCLVF